MSVSGYQDQAITAEQLEPILIEPLVQAALKVISGLFTVWSAAKKLFALLATTGIGLTITRIMGAYLPF